MTGSRFIHLSRTDSNSFSWLHQFHYTYVLHRIYPFTICRKERRRRYREWACEHSWGGESGANGERSINTYTVLGMRWVAGEKGRSCCVAQGAQSGAL